MRNLKGEIKKKKILDHLPESINNLAKPHIRGSILGLDLGSEGDYHNGVKIAFLKFELGLGLGLMMGREIVLGVEKF